MNKLISVIVVAYNNESTLVETLDSIYGQTYKQIELLISDDCSTDKTAEIAKQWLEKKRERFVNARIIEGTVNKGIPANINKALKAASGEYIQLIAGDDMFLPDGLRIRMDHISDDAKEIIITRLNYFGDIRYIDSVREMQKKTVLFCDFSRKKQLREILKRSFIVPLGTGPIHRDVYKVIGAYDERFSLDEDWIFFLKLISKGFKFKFFDQATAMYRLTGNSVSRGINYKYYICQKELFEKVRAPLMRKNGMYFTLLNQKIAYYRDGLLFKYGRESLQYRISIMLLLIQPPVISQLIRKRLCHKGDMSR